MTADGLVQLVALTPVAEVARRLPTSVARAGVQVTFEHQTVPGTLSTGSRRYPGAWSAGRAGGPAHLEIAELGMTTSQVELRLGPPVRQVDRWRWPTTRRAAAAAAVTREIRDRVEAAGSTSPQPVGTGRRRRRRLPRIALAGPIAALLMLLAVPQLFAAQPVSVDTATERYRTAVAAEDQQVPPASTAAPAATDTPTAAPAESSRAPVADTEPVAPRADAGPVTHERVVPAEEQDRRPSTTVPASGVYRYATDGWEELNVPRSRRSYPEETAQTVMPTDCGYRVHWEPLEEHTDTYELCEAGEARVLARLTTFRSFFGNDHTMDLRCTPLGQPTTRQWRVHCSGDDTEMSVVSRLLGTEEVGVGSETVTTEHVRLESEVTGASEGLRRADMWLVPGSGLLVRSVVSTDMETAGPFGPVRYRESYTIHLQDLEPAT